MTGLDPGRLVDMVPLLEALFTITSTDETSHHRNRYLVPVPVLNAALPFPPSRTASQYAASVQENLYVRRHTPCTIYMYFKSSLTAQNH